MERLVYLQIFLLNSDYSFWTQANRLSNQSADDQMSTNQSETFLKERGGRATFWRERLGHVFWLVDRGLCETWRLCTQIIEFASLPGFITYLE